MALLSSTLYATLGVFVAELILQGVNLIVNAPVGVIRNFLISLFIFFIISAIFLEPLMTRMKVVAGLIDEIRGRGLFWGIVGLGIAFIFLLTDAAIEHAINHNPPGAIFLFLALLFVPGLTTIGWIVGAREGKRAAIYGALLAFVSDFVVRVALWYVTGSVEANPSLTSDPLSTALFAGGAGGIQAGFFGFCGGLAIDRSQNIYVVRNLAIGLLLGILIWAIAYHFLGGKAGLSSSDIYSQINASIVRIVDYTGLVVGLALCSSFPQVLERQRAA